MKNSPFIACQVFCHFENCNWLNLQYKTKCAQKNKVINFKWYFLCLSCAFLETWLQKKEWIVCSSGEIFVSLPLIIWNLILINENSSSKQQQKHGSVRQSEEEEEGENEEENNNRVHLISWFRSVIDTQLMILYFHIGSVMLFFLDWSKNRLTQLTIRTDLFNLISAN